MRYYHSLNLKSVRPVNNPRTMMDRKGIWVRRHRGALTRIAVGLDVTVSQVSAVLYGKWPSKDGKVERALIRAGAPGVNPGDKRKQ